MPKSAFHLHLVSDSTGETLLAVARAAMAQFDANRETVEHLWTLVRTPAQLERVIQSIESQRGLVLYTLVDPDQHGRLDRACRKLKLPAIDVMGPVLHAFSEFLGEPARGLPGGQHLLTQEYYDRIEAMQFTMAHDDGHMPPDLDQADIVLLGVSRSSKTPTSIYLANRGFRVVNIPIIPSMPLPAAVYTATKPLIVGLTTSPDRLVQLRRSRLLALNQKEETDYIDIDRVSEEVAEARRLFAGRGWPVIDVTRRSIEETAAAIMTLYQRRRDEQADLAKPKLHEEAQSPKKPGPRKKTAAKAKAK